MLNLVDYTILPSSPILILPFLASLPPNLQDVVGIDRNLMAPWHMAEKLCPGTLVAVEANLIVYSFCKPLDPSTVHINFLLCAAIF